MSQSALVKGGPRVRTMCIFLGVHCMYPNRWDDISQHHVHGEKSKSHVMPLCECTFGISENLDVQITQDKNSSLIFPMWFLVFSETRSNRPYVAKKCTKNGLLCFVVVWHQSSLPIPQGKCCGAGFIALQWRHNVTMSVMASQITGNSTVCSTVCSDVHQRKHQRSALLALCPLTKDQ